MTVNKYRWGKEILGGRGGLRPKEELFFRIGET